MKRLVCLDTLLPGTLGLLVLMLVACDSSPGREDVEIPDGSYTEFGERAVVDGSVVYAHTAGGYVYRTLQVEDDRVAIRVHSDYIPEDGTAKGRYVAEGESVRIIVDSSTTAYYEPGDEEHYDEVNVVDGSFRITFRAGEDTLAFEGPGLILTEVTTDEDDADEDNTTDETLKVNHYFSLNSE